jgi:diguanylate cyclase (GGDEF)-like protein
LDKITDKLTGLLLKKEFEFRLLHEVQRAMRYRRPLTLMVMEVDFGFFEKEINIRASMPYTIFKQLGPIILKQLRTVDFAGRIAGETFSAMMPETPLGGAFVAADRLRQAVEGYEFIGDNLDRRLKVALNIGVASFPEHGTSSDELMSSANKALLIARRDGGNKTIVYPQVLYQASEVFKPLPGAFGAGAPPSAGEEAAPAPVAEGAAGQE